MGACGCGVLLPAGIKFTQRVNGQKISIFAPVVGIFFGGFSADKNQAAYPAIGYG